MLVEHPELLRGASVVYRKSGGAFASRPLERAPGAAYAATIPAAAVTAPGIAYTIEIERLDGVRAAAFATREDPHPVQVLEDRGVVRETALLDRLKGRRSVATASAELVRFGSTRGDKPLPCTPSQEGCGAGGTGVPDVDDQYYRVEAGYTYRPLGAVAEFSLRAGFVRGTSLVPTETLDPSKYEVGLNYGAPTVRFRLADAWHLETEFLTSITEVGFSVGAGGALLIGDPYGSKVTLGVETIGFEEGTYFGSRFYSRVDIAAADRFTIAPIVEVTDMPHATAFGVRLLGEATVDLGAGFGASLRGGYQARRSTSGGPSVGGGVSLAF